MESYLRQPDPSMFDSRYDFCLEGVEPSHNYLPNGQDTNAHILSKGNAKGRLYQLPTGTQAVDTTASTIRNDNSTARSRRFESKSRQTAPSSR
jgi:hypothetical protein